MKGLTDELLYKTIHDYLEIFLPKMRKCSPNTVRSYRKAISALLDFAAREKKLSLSAITFPMLNSTMVAAYLDSVEAAGASITTRNQRLQAIRSFFSYAGMSDPSCMFYKSDVSKVPAKKNPSLSSPSKPSTIFRTAEGNSASSPERA